ncbi:MAG: hypothetical protein WC052_06225 [Patescibacteria group bacterium]
MSIKADKFKMENAVRALLATVVASGKDICFFDINAFCASLKLSHLSKAQYHDTFTDILTGSDVHKVYGDWVTCEYEMNIRVLVQLSKAGETQSVYDDKNYFATFGDETIRRAFPTKQKMMVDVPADMSVEDVQAAIHAYQTAAVKAG